MTTPLFRLLLALTLVDLGFVHATGVVPELELAPLWALTLAAPWLRRLQRHLAYRLGWNVLVLAVFASLANHAATSGLLHMLEDGLTLAALSQVHLINNVGGRQRPDLLFFNSFLIAFVTGFFAPDLSWCALFALHAFLVVPALQWNAIEVAGVALDPARARALWRTALGHTVALLAITALLFVAWPRDFRRKGWIDDNLPFAGPVTGGGERIRVDDEDATPLSPNVVARIRPDSGKLDDVPAHWRTMVFAAFDGREWHRQDLVLPAPRFRTDFTWRAQEDGVLTRADDATPVAGMALTLLAAEHGRLPSPLGAVRIAATTAASGTLKPHNDGTLTLDRDARMPVGGTWRVDVAASPRRVGIAPMTRKRLTALPPRLPVAVRELSDELRRSGAAEGTIATRADEATRWLQRNRRYMLPGQEGFARNLGDFLLGGGAGHCEYFATALTLLLRQQDIPCRLVGGYLAREWDDAAQEVVVRGRHAHAWVEVLDERGAWLTFDPTPPAEIGDGAAGDSMFAHIRDALESAWASVTGFNATSRGEAFAALGRAARDHGWLVGLAAAAIAGLAALARAGRQPATVRQLRRAMRRAGLRLAPGETPRELIARAIACGVPATRRARLAAAVAAHDAARYAAPVR
ncbi:MAG: DUF3488 domain-containing protein [Phycisphaerales bacterium]|nr:DUF3488 domain-containing protein [Phycisphaerales bacterium]